MRLVYKFHIKHDAKLFKLCMFSKNLYNQALYIVKKELKENNKWVGYSYLNKELQTTTNLEGGINYRLLKAQVSQQCLRTLDKNIKSYIKSIKDYSKNKSKYKGVPKFPKYKKDVNQIIYTNQCSSIKEDGFLYLDKKTKIRIPQFEKYKSKFKTYQQVRIIPKLDKSFAIEIIYTLDNEYNNGLDKNLFASIDLGINNLAAMILPDSNPILFNGKQVKAKNQYFNKQISNLKSKLTNNKRTSNKIQTLYLKRDNQMTDIFHKLSKMIINKLIEHKIGNIVVGYNKGWKDSINIGKRNNQTFVQISYEKLINYLKYKCEMIGINLIINEEGYTSKCDGLALEDIKKHSIYLGKRIKRGLFKSSVGKLINADINGSLNILRKVVGDSVLVKQIINSGWLFQPLRVDVLFN
jgi:putative transposase